MTSFFNFFSKTNRNMQKPTVLTAFNSDLERIIFICVKLSNQSKNLIKDIFVLYEKFITYKFLDKCSELPVMRFATGTKLPLFRVICINVIVREVFLIHFSNSPRLRFEIAIVVWKNIAMKILKYDFFAMGLNRKQNFRTILRQGVRI